MKRAVFLGIWLALLLLRVGTLQGQSYTYIMTDGLTTITPCMGNFYDPGGQNGDYNNGLDYTQTFKASSSTECLMVTFTSFETESGYDKLYVYDGESATGSPLGTYTGELPSFSVVSSSGALTFVFHSDGSVQKPGWEATFSCVECSLPSPTEPDYSMHHGTDTINCLDAPRPFYDPGGFGGSYDNNSDYIQTFVSSDPSKCLTVTFYSFATEWNFDKLFIYDGTVATGTILGVYSGYIDTFAVSSFTGVLTFVFHTDNTTNELGWVAEIGCSDCGEPPEPSENMHYGTDTIDCSQGPRPFYDPGGPDGSYDPLSEYIQTFVLSDPEGCLQVTFTSIEVEEGWDVLYVYDGHSVFSTLVATLTGSMSNVTIISSTGALTFQFFSYSFDNYAGWEATLSCVECPDLNIMHNGKDTVYCSQSPMIFYDPGGPYGNYGTNQSYTQTFVASDPEKCLQVTFTSFETEPDNDKLAVYNGTSALGTPFETYSGSIPSTFTVTSLTGALTFKFTSNGSEQREGWEALVSCSDCHDTCIQKSTVNGSPCSEETFAHPFCTEDNPYGITYASGTGSENAHSTFFGISSGSVGCLYTTPRPAWYYMQIDQPGDLLILIQQFDTSGVGHDVDFACWGPFSASSQSDFMDKLCCGKYWLYTNQQSSHHPTNGDHSNNQTGGYPYDNLVDCSYSSSYQEWCYIPNAQEGQWYLLLITNYSGQPGFITFSTVGEYSTATTNCNLLAPISYNDPLCEGDTLVLTCENPITGATYNWSGPGGWTAVTTLPNVSIPNVSTSQSGQYTLQITGIDTTVAPSQVDVTIHAIPQVTVTVSADIVCEGTSVTLQAGGATNYQWSPTAGTGSSITVTPEITTIYTVVGTTDGCADTVVRQVTVLQNTTGDTSIVACDSILWNGVYYYADTLLHDTLVNAQNCDSIVSVHLTVAGMPEITINTQNTVICAGNSVTLKATNGQGFSYQWNTGATTAMIVEMPEQTTEYSVTVTNGSGCKDSVSVTITVGENSEQTFYDTVCQGEAYDGYGFTLTAEETDTLGTLNLTHTDTIGPGCVSSTTLLLTVAEVSYDTIFQTACDSFVWNGITYNLSGYYTNTLQTVNGCDSLVTLDLTVGQAPDIQITTNPSPAEVCAGEEITLTAVTECGELETILFEDFDGLVGGSDTTAGVNGPSNTQLTLPSNQLTDAFISGVRVYPAGDAIKLGNSSNVGVGSITSNYLDLTQDFTVTVRAKGWLFYNNNPPKNTKIRVSTNQNNAQEITVPGNSDFTDYTFAFSAAGENAQVTIETVRPTGGDWRVFIDYVRITRNIPCSYYWYTATDTISSETEITVVPSSTDWYYFSATSPTGCERTDSVEVVVNTPEHQAYSVESCGSYMWIDGVTYTASGDHTYSHTDAHGCTQMDTLHLTIMDTVLIHVYDTVCLGYEYFDYGFEVAEEETGEAGIEIVKSRTDKGINGCDSTTVLHLMIKDTVLRHIYDTVCFNGGGYDSLGFELTEEEMGLTDTVLISIEMSANECDSTTLMHLTIHHPVAELVEVTTCDSYTWTAGNEETYTTGGTYTYSHDDANGCTQVDTLHLTIYNPEHTAVTETACGSYTWAANGQTYTASCDTTYSHADAHGCTQVDTLHLTIHNPTHTAITVSECGSYTWTEGDGQTYTASCDTTYSHTDANGCTQVDTLHLTIYNPVHQAYTEEACGSFTWTDGDGQTYTASCDTTYSHADAHGCTQVDTLHLTIHNPTHTAITVSECGSYTWTEGDGQTYTVTNTYTYSHEDASGCTQVDTLHLTIHNPTHTAITVSECGSYTWAEGDGQTYTASCDTTYSHTDAYGCTQVDTLHLTIHNPTHTAITVSECGSFTWTEGDGQTYTASCDTTYSHADAYGCLQVDTLHLTITDSEPTEIYATVCENYEWYDGDILMDIYTSSCDTTITFTNATTGCDSVVTLHLIVKSVTFSEETVTECESYTWNGITYDSSGVYEWPGTGANGCDSTAILYLTILHPEHQALTVTAYDSLTWTEGNGNTYYQSGTYTFEHCDTNGCTQKDTLNLTIYYTSENEYSKVACDSYEWEGVTYTQSDTYVRHFSDIHGADSTVTLHLTIYNSTHNAETIIACESYEWHGQIYDSSGTYTYAYTNTDGCASVDTLHLTVIPTPVVTISGPHLFCPDSSVTLTAVTETAPESYLWSNGDTTASITVSVADVYTVTAYYAGECSAESAGFHVFETEDPIVYAFLNDMVAGDTQTVIIGTLPVDTSQNGGLQYAIPQSTLTYSTVTFLPDGVPCEPLGCSYTAEMVFSGFPDTAVIHSADEIRYIRLNMEHSAPVDLYIRLTCPNGNQADILRKYIDDSQSDCLGSIDGSHMGWPDGNVHSAYYSNPLIYPVSIRPWMGQQSLSSLSDDAAHPCDSAKNKPGVGWNYCWSDNTTEGYQYASANGCLVDTSNSIYYYSNGIQDLYHLSYIIMDSTHVAAGTQYYHPDESFDSLIGCPVNGPWTVEVIDGMPLDNGYIFECELGVAEHLSGTHYANVSEMDFDGLWTGFGGSDSTFVITPPEDLENDTTVAYTFTLLDENGCTFDTVIYINIYAHKHVDLYDTVNASDLPLVWGGLTFNGAGCQDTVLQTVHGADSVVTLHLSVIYHYDTAVCANKIPLDWHNQTFYSTSSVTVSQSVESGCADSIEVLMVKVNPVYRDTLRHAMCDNEPPFQWRDDSYSATGTYYDILTAVTGCDSIYVLELTVNPTFAVPLTAAICEGDTFQFFGQPLTEGGVYSETLQTVHGCDSVVTLTLVVNPIYSISLADTICEGDTFHFFSQHLTETGVYTETLQTIHGCDSVFTLNLTVHPTYSIPLMDTICQGDTFLFFGQPLTETGVYTETLQTVHGCDSVFTLNLTVHPTYSIPMADTICQGDTFHFFSQSLTETGVYTETLQTVHGCDSVFTLSLTVHPTYSILLTDTICQGDTVHFFEQLLTETGVYTETLQTVHGCDSVYTLNLTVHPTYSIALLDTICEGDTILFFGQPLTEEGVYTETLQTIHGCDSVYTLNLTVHPTYSIPLADTICQGDTFHFFSQSLTEAGVYTETLQTVHGCDSVFTLSLTVHPTYSIPLTDTICQGDTVHFFEQSLTETGVYTETLQTVHGCDSVYTLTLTVHPTYSIPLMDTICQGDTFLFFGQPLTEEGVYTETLQTVHGCDSVYTLTLTVHPTYSISLTDAICQGDTFLFFGQPLTEEGVYTETLQTVHGCDSIIELTLTVNEIFHHVTDTVICESDTPFVWRGNGYSVTNTYYDTVSAPLACDSIFTLNLSVHQITFADTFATACDSFVWRGVTYHETPAFLPADTVVGGNVGGCDSVTVLHLTVHHSVERADTVSICEGDLPFIYGGTVFEVGTQSGNYVLHDTTVNGCDSTVTLHLQVKQNIYEFRAATICENMIPASWEGHYWNGEGTIIDVLSASNGCDSIVTKTLTVGTDTYTTIVDTVLENDLPYQLNGIEYNSTGIYHDMTMNMAGCDSIITLDLTVFFNDTITIDSTVCDNELGFYWNGVCFTEADTQSVVLTASTGADSVVVMRVHVIESPDVTISGPPVFCADNFAQLTAVSATAFSYHWSTGDTTQSINANITGIYAVTVTNEYGCKDSDLMNLSEAVIVNPIASYQFPDLCAGNDYSITIGHQSISTIVLDNPESTLSWADTVFLPDGEYCDPYGCAYQSPLTFTDFAPGSTVSSVNDILYVRLNMEHSYAGDLYIKLTCPNGQKADILKYNGTGTSNCNSSIPQSSRHWTGPNYLNASDDTYFGMAYDHSSSGNNACNPNTNNNAPGIGWNYCWSNNNNQGYTYAPGQGSLVYRSVNVHTHTNAYYTSFWSGEDHYVDIFDSSNVAAGTQFYHPDQSFQSLVGCPLNGSWTIEVMDGWSQDNGYIFGWELALAPYLVPSPYSDVTTVTVDGPWVTTVSDTSFIFSPPDTLEHDTLVAYTFHLQDQYGCGYDTTVYLNVYAQSHTVIDTNVCASFDYNGVTYTQSETITWNGVNVHGCDSTCVINLTVYPMPTTAITGLPVPCVDDTAHLAAVCADLDALLVWSTGDTAQTITVTSSGDYTVTATNAKCSYDETVTVTFSSPNESTTDLTVCDSILWNGTVYTQTGSYVKTLTNAAGCDSVATLNLTVNYSYLSHDTLYLLENQLPYTFEPSDTLFPVGSPAEFQFSYTLPAQNSCDSVIMEKVYVYMNYYHTFDTLVCALPLTWHGHTFTAAGTITDALFTVHGSDSILVYTVTVDTISVAIGNVTHINCYGESNGAATATVTGGVSPLAYQWTDEAGASVSSTTQISNRLAGSYTFTVTDEAGCTATQTVTINLLHGQMLPGAITGPQEFCYGETLGTVNGTAATGDDCVYQWQISGNGTSWTPATGVNNTQNYTFTDVATESFQVRRAWISGSCGTLYSDTLSVNVWPVSNDTIHDAICEGEPYQQHGFDIPATETMGQTELTSVNPLTNIHGCDSLVTLVLDIFEPQETVINAEVCEGEGYYLGGFSVSRSETVGADTLLRILNYQTVEGCDSVVRLEVTVIDTMLRIVSPTADFCEDMSAELIVETNMPDYEWSTGEQLPNITVMAPGIYSVTASQGGCSVTARYVIEPCVIELYLPNAISPSREDGLNDYFGISEYAQGTINLFEISIFNRWGEMVFHSTDKGFRWNGEYKGKIYHQTVYNYVIRYTDSAGRPFRVTGSVTVL